MESRQLPLLGEGEDRGAFGPPLARPTTELTRESPLAVAVGVFHDQMMRRGYSENTIRCFLSDLRILMRYLGPDRAIGAIATKDLRDFLAYLRYYRGRPCSPKSYARRVTTLKALFGWLVEEEVIPRDPSAPIPQESVDSPLPQILYADQVQRLLETTRRLMEAPEDPDPRPHLLVTLLLKTGIKKGEASRIHLSHIDLSDPQGPVLYVRYSDPRRRYKERKLRLPDDFGETLARYRERYRPKERLFECTPRNLEYVLGDVAELAELPQGLSFEMLRWTCAVRDYRAGMARDKLRQKLGLSGMAWQHMLKRLQVLAGPAL